MMDKKGQIAYKMILIGTIVLVATALFSFVSFDNSFETRSSEFYKLAYRAEFNEHYIRQIFESSVKGALVGSNNEADFKSKFESIVGEKDLRLDIGGNFFGKIRSRDYALNVNDGRYVVSVEGVFVKAQIGKSEIVRNFDLLIEVDKG